MSTRSPDPTRTLPDQTQTHPRPSQFIYSIPELICSIPEGMLHWRLLSKHSWSGEHHSWIHLTILNEPETSWIPSTHPWTWRLSMHNHDRAKPERLAVFPIKSYFFLSYLLLSVSPYPCPVPFCHSFPPSILYRLVLTIPSRTTSVLTLTITPRPFLPGPCLSYYLV